VTVRSRVRIPVMSIKCKSLAWRSSFKEESKRINQLIKVDVDRMFQMRKTTYNCRSNSPMKVDVVVMASGL